MLTFNLLKVEIESYVVYERTVLVIELNSLPEENVLRGACCGSFVSDPKRFILPVLAKIGLLLKI